MIAEEQKGEWVKWLERRTPEEAKTQKWYRVALATAAYQDAKLKGLVRRVEFDVHNKD